MSLRQTVRAFPTLFRTGFSVSTAYRAEMIIFALSATMPLVMLALWSAVAADGPVGGYSQPQFEAYFLAEFIVQQLTGCASAWQITFEVRTGTLAMRLLRPVHPFAVYASDVLATLPMKIVIALPVAAILLLRVGPGVLPRDPVIWGYFLLSLAGSWLITFLASAIIGSLSLFMESGLKLLDLWQFLFMLFSGYIVPVDLFSPRVRAVLDWLPFRYQIGLPVELVTSRYDRLTALPFLARQAVWVLAFWAIAAWVWKRGLKRFGAFGG